MTMAAHPPRIPLRQRINFRLLGFIAIFACLLGGPLYIYLDSVISGGLKNRGDYYDVDLKSMVSFSFDQEAGTVDDVPPRWRELDGKTVVMQGEVAPGGFVSTGVGHKFELVYSVAKCCIGVPPQIQHFVQVSVPNDARVDVKHGGAIEVKGQLRVEVTRDPDTGKINGVYHVRADNVTSL